MLTEECRARIKQKEAIESEQNNKYNKASSLYSVAKVIWGRIKDSTVKQQFCDSRRKHCDAMALISDDDDESI